MNVLVIVFLVIIMLFGFVIFFGAPYLPTLREQRLEALELLNMSAGQTLIELGSGDGSFLLLCAKSHVKAIGYELNPLLVILSKIRLVRHRRYASVHWANFWHKDLSGADAIFAFLLPKYMEKLDRKIIDECGKGTKLASYAFEIPAKKPAKRLGAVFLYKY